MKFIKKYKTVLILLVVCLFLMILASFAVYRMFYPSNDKSVYGDRLINAPEISSEVIDKIEKEITNTNLVSSFKYRTSVKTMVFTIDVKENTQITDAEKLSEKIINNLSSDIIDFYDISVYLIQSSAKLKEYPAIGYSSKGDKTFNWIINKEVASSEN